MPIVLVFTALFVCATGSSRAQTCRVAGIVVNDANGAPLGRTRVSLAEVQDRRKAESVITEADGRFEFRNVPAGKFSLEGARRDFMITTYQWHEGFSTAIVTGAGLGTENLVLRLIPLGSIAGKVIDETGEPVRNANVKLAMRRLRLGEDRVFGNGYVQTDDEGTYEFRDLIPGQYFVSVAARPWYAVYPVWVTENGVRTRVDTIAPELNVAYARTYYDGATESAGATPLSVTKGEQLTADIHLNPVPALTVTIKVEEDPTHRTVEWATLQKMDFDGPEQVSINTISGPNQGEMEINGVAPGTYAIARSRGGMVRGTGQIVELTKDAQFVEAKATEATGTVNVKLKTARGEDLPVSLSLSLRDEHRHTVGYADVRASGEAAFENVSAGRYALMAHFSQPPPYTIGKMKIQGVEIDGHDFTVGEGATVDIDATLMAGMVAVEGVVKRTDGKPASGAMVALVPKGMDARGHFERIRWDQSNLDGSFLVRQILPGTYTLIGQGWVGICVAERGSAGEVFGEGAAGDRRGDDEWDGDAAGGGGGAGQVGFRRMGCGLAAAENLHWEPTRALGSEREERASARFVRMTSSLKFKTMIKLAAGGGGFDFDDGGDGADDGAFAGGTRLAVVADEKMLDDFVDAGVLEAGEFGVFVKGKVAGAPDLAQAAEDSASFALEGL